VMDATPAPQVTLEITSRFQRFRLPLLPAPLAPPMAGPLPAVVAAGTTPEYSEMDTDFIMASCGLDDDEWLTDLPRLYSRMLTDGRKTIKVRATLQALTRPRELSMDAIVIPITDDMAKDVKDLNFGYMNDLAYSTCHRGISPFTVVPVKSSTAAMRSRKDARLRRVTTVTMNDDMESTPDPLPKDFNGLLHLLRCYLALLEVVVGKKCPHFKYVQLIGRELGGNRPAFESMSPRDVATIVWQMFLDSRRFFTDATNDTGIQPVSRLDVLLDFISIGNVPILNNAPFRELLGTTDDATVHGAPARATAREDRSIGTAVTSGSHLGLTFPVPTDIAEIFRGGLTRYPGLHITDVMATPSPPVPYAKYRLGPSGTCMDFVCFGKCANPSCSFKHSVSLQLNPGQTQRAAPHIKAAYNAYKVAHA
jgi:hypothetical protein